jgi:hypothetical protein
MTIVEATHDFESWLARQTTVVRTQLTEKHRRMAESPLIFLRGTIYRWSQMWPDVCPDLMRAPRVLAVGDLHVDSFGTWRDVAGRLVWGADDFDEAFYLPYTQDLLRLAVSARLAISEESLALNWKDACDSILEGYRDRLSSGGKAFVLEEQHHWLRTIALARLDDPCPFWKKLLANPSPRKPVPRGALHALKQLLPEADLTYRITTRTAGVGSLGHRRFVALVDWRGGKLALEAKALVPSAFCWAERRRAPLPIYYQRLLDRAVRARDPFVRLIGPWIVRQLSPDSSPVELASLPRKRPEDQLLHAMGWETANVHLATRRAVKAVQSDVGRRPASWLRSAARQMSKLIVEDWKNWIKYQT